MSSFSTGIEKMESLLVEGHLRLIRTIAKQAIFEKNIPEGKHVNLNI